MKLSILKKCGPFILSACLVLLFFYPVLFSDKTFFLRDFHRWFYPMKYYLASCFRKGAIPYWCPYYFCGAPFLSDIQSGVFYPFSLLLTFFSFPRALNFFIVVHFFLGFIFFYYFIRKVGVSRETSLVVSTSYSYGSYTIASVNTLNNLSTLIWLPALLWSFYVARFERRPAAYFWSVLCLCMLFLGGEPQLALLAMVLLVFSLLIFPAKEFRGLRRWPENSFAIFILLLSAVLITMVQLGPTFQDYQLSVRKEGFQYAEAARFSLNPAMLKHLFVPLSFPAHYEADVNTLATLFPGTHSMPWLLTVYPGMIILPLAFFGLLFRFSKGLLFWVILFIITILLALGRHTPLYALFYAAFPFFRFPEKFMFLSSFALLVMAAHGFEHFLLKVGKAGWKRSVWFSIALLFIVSDLFFAHAHLNPLCEATFYTQYDPSLKPVVTDTGIYRIYVDPETVASGPERMSILDYHRRWQMFLMPNLGLLRGLSYSDGVTGMELRYQSIITDLLTKPWPERIRLLRLFNVKYIVSSSELDKNPELADDVAKVNGYVYRVKDYLPRAWIVSHVVPFKKGTPEELAEPSFDPYHMVLAKKPGTETSLEPYYEPVDSLRYEEGGRIHIEVSARKKGFLVLSESSYPGWRVFVDGREKECLWLNLLFQGVEIDSGRHDIDFVFRPKGFAIFALISAVSLFLFFVGFIVFGLRKNNRFPFRKG
jgi:hypothetical protein